MSERVEPENFSWPVRVYWEDTDGGGVVYHAAYLCFCERARTEWLRARGIEQERLRALSDIVFVVCDVNLKFRKPARLDDLLDISVEVLERRSASMTFQQRLVRRSDGALLVEARLRVACLQASSFRPRPIPDDLLQEIPKA